MGLVAVPSLHCGRFLSVPCMLSSLLSFLCDTQTGKKDDSDRIKLTVFKLVHFYNLQVKDLIKLIKGHLQNRILTSATAIA